MKLYIAKKSTWLIEQFLKQPKLQFLKKKLQFVEKINLFSLLAYIDGERRWQTLLLSALYLCGRHGKHQKSFQRLSRHHSKNASAAIRAVIGMRFTPSVDSSFERHASPSLALMVTHGITNILIS